MRTMTWLAVAGMLALFVGCSGKVTTLDDDSKQPGTGGGTAGSGASAGSGGVAGSGAVAGSAGTAGATGGAGGATGGAGGATGGAGGATGGAGGATACPFQTGYPPCDGCIQSACAAQCATCASEPECVALLECILDCPPNNDACINDCVTKHQGGINAILPLLGDNGCVQAQCAGPCGGGGSGGGTGGGTGQCPIDFGYPACDSCLDLQCADECLACANNPQCEGLLDCLMSCQNDDACQQGCVDQFPGGIDPVLEFVGQQGCAAQNCGVECGGGSGGSGGSPGQCPIQSGDPACDDCLNTLCLDECVTCANDQDCVDLLVCISNCNNDQQCTNGCVNQYPNGIDPLLAFVGQNGCVAQSCGGACGGGSGGSGGAGGSGGSGGAGGSGGSTAQCTITTGSAACDTCMSASCASQCVTCAGNTACIAMKACVDACPANDQQCRWQCGQTHSAGVWDYLSLYGDQFGCLAQNCGSACP